MKVTRVISIKLLVLFVILALSCAKAVYKPRLFFGSSEAKWANKVLSKMTLEEKIGQMFVCPYSGRFFNKDSEEIQRLKELVIKRKVGGFILYGRNVYETAHLTNYLQKLAKTPLMIASDLERGLGEQIDEATQFPPLMALGAISGEEQAYLMGKVTAAEARAIGIHVTYAPVVDVNINPENPIINTRSFGEDPEQVSRLAAAYIRGCQQNGLMATAKHFPGHGDTVLDSHIELPTVEGELERLEEVELYPFERAIEAGVSLIMTAHISLPALDPTPNLPATLSPRILTGLLREKLGFKGIIVTDAMGMGGITSSYSPVEAAVRTVQAGSDIILNSPQVEEVMDAFVQAVKKGEISEARIDASVRRVLEAKARLGLYKKRMVDITALDRIIASKEHRRLAEEMFENSITLVKNDNQILPLSDPEAKIVVFSLSSDPGGYFAGREFVGEVEEKSSEVISFYADRYTGDEFIQEGLAKAEEADVVVFALFSARRAWKGSVDIISSHVHHIKVVKDTTAKPIPVVVVSFGSPYFLRHFPEVDSYLCVYRESGEAQRTAAKAIFGEIDIQGRLPVTLPGLYPYGHGIRLLKKTDK